MRFNIPFAAKTIIPLLACLLLPALAAAAAPPHTEAQVFQLGGYIGYGNFCAKQAGVKDFKDPEAKAFGQHYGQSMREIGPKGQQIYREGVKKGFALARSESGEKCRQNLERLLKMYEDIQLKGTFYGNVLKKLHKPQ